MAGFGNPLNSEEDTHEYAPIFFTSRMSESSISVGNHTSFAMISKESHVRPKIVNVSMVEYGVRVMHEKSGLK